MRVVIADDEPLAREMLRMRIEREADMDIIGEARDGEEAVSLIVEMMPDLVFLDIHMPGLTGFEVLQAIPEPIMPLIVFVTAYDEYALKAFDVHATDYLLKPFDEQRFRKTLQRIRSHQSPEEPRRRIQSLLEQQVTAEAGVRTATNGTSLYLQRFVVKDNAGYRLLRTTDIDWIESAGNYVRLHSASGAAYVVRATMGELERTLDPDQFTRIHRSSIVNIDRITEFRPAAYGDFTVLLASGRTVRMSRHYRDRLLPWRR